MKPTVLFDLGDVLVHLRFDRGLAHFARLGGGNAAADLDPVKFFLGEHALAWNRGELSAEQFFRKLAEATGIPGVSLAEVEAAWCDIFDPWPEMEALATEVLDAGCDAFLLSNTDPVHFALLRQRIAPLQRFTGLHLSYEIGITKPDPRFFTSAIERLKLDPARCAFIDDRPDNVQAAARVGIPSVRHAGDVGEVRRFLEGRGALG